MNAHTKMEPPGVIADMAQRFGMNAEAFERTVRATCLPPDRKTGREATREEFAAFLLVAKTYDLNPLTREIYGMPKKGGGIQAVVSVDGWSKLVNSNAAFDGMQFHDEIDDKGNVIAITCRMFRKDRNHPIEATEYLSECRQNHNDSPWDKWPRRMLRHKALIQAARYAFGFAGIVDPDEAARFIPGAPQMQIGSHQRDVWELPEPPQAMQIEHQPEPVPVPAVQQIMAEQKRYEDQWGRPTGTAEAVTNAIKGAAEWPDLPEILDRSQKPANDPGPNEEKIHEPPAVMAGEPSSGAGEGNVTVDGTGPDDGFDVEDAMLDLASWCEAAQKDSDVDDIAETISGWELPRAHRTKAEDLMDEARSRIIAAQQKPVDQPKFTLDTPKNIKAWTEMLITTMVDKDSVLKAVAEFKATKELRAKVLNGDQFKYITEMVREARDKVLQPPPPPEPMVEPMPVDLSKKADTWDEFTAQARAMITTAASASVLQKWVLRQSETRQALQPSQKEWENGLKKEIAQRVDELEQKEQGQ